MIRQGQVYRVTKENSFYYRDYVKVISIDNNRAEVAILNFKSLGRKYCELISFNDFNMLKLEYDPHEPQELCNKYNILKGILKGEST